MCPSNYKDIKNSGKKDRTRVRVEKEIWLILEIPQFPQILSTIKRDNQLIRARLTQDSERKTSFVPLLEEYSISLIRIQIIILPTGKSSQ